MSWWEYVILAVVQGIAEILPISSSAHLQIARALLGIGEPSIIFDIALHFASAVAVIVFYWKRLWQLASDSFTYIFKRDASKEPAFRYVIMLVIATIPAGLLGFLLNDFIGSLFGSLLAVGVFLMITGMVLYLSQFLGGSKSKENISYIDALVIGLFQSIGLFPGISRSGITLIGTKVRQLKAEDAAEFVFILFIPLALAAGLLGLLDWTSSVQLLDGQWVIIASILSGIVTYVSLTLLLAIVRKGKVFYFGYYTFLAGAIVIISTLL